MVNKLFCKEDLERFIRQNGPVMELHGNIAVDGVSAALETVPEDMIGMRGVVRKFSHLEELLTALQNQKIHTGDAMFLLEEGSVPAAACDRLSLLLEGCGASHLLVVFSAKPEKLVRGAVNMWYASPRTAKANHADVLKENDRMEYDLTSALFGVDLIECLDHRISAEREAPFYVRQMQHQIWMIGEEFTRMFLIIGSNRALLIDAGFGYADLYQEVRKITDLPLDVALTHGHFDHAGGIRFFEKVSLHADDYEAVEKKQGHEILEKLIPLEDGHQFDLGGRTVEAIALPGHSKGSVVFLERETGILFGGDSLLCGPYFLLGGEKDIRQLSKGLTRLLDPETGARIFYPAHRDLFPMYQEDIREILALLAQILDGSIPGCPTWIAPIMESPYKTYRRGIYSVYAP